MTRVNEDTPQSANPGTRPWYSISRRVAGLLVGTLVFVRLLVLLVPTAPPEWKVRRSVCQLGLQQLGCELADYAKGHGHYPSKLEQQFRGPDTRNYTVCPTTGKPYIYRGANLAWPAPAGTVLAHDELSNHETDGEPKVAYFLFADSFAWPVPIGIARKAVVELDAGHNPPRAPELQEFWKAVEASTQPTSHATTSAATRP